jgi:F-type H+-transporting ATPase subunit gamma
MAQNLIDLRRRIKAVKNTQKTTQAMKTVSAVKMRRNVMELNRTQPMMKQIESALKRVTHSSTDNIGLNPFLKKRKKGKTLLVVVAGDKGLCGAFNSRLIETAEDHYKELINEDRDNIRLIVVGNKAFKHFRKKGYEIEENYQSIMARLQYEDALELSTYLQKAYLAQTKLKPGEEERYKDKYVKAVEFVYTRHISSARQEPAIKRFFPIEFEWENEDGEGNGGNEKDLEYIFEPSAKEIFDALLPKYINYTVYQTLLQSAASEQTARMVAMDLATRNASDMIRSLTLVMNKIRQTSITMELLEIMTATEALAK